MPGDAALSSGARSAAARRRESMVRNPAIAGPKPTHAMSTAMDWRSIFVGSCRLLRVVEGLGDHDPRGGLGGAILREHRAREAAVELRPHRPEVGDPLARGAGALLVRVAAGLVELVHRAAGAPRDDPPER